jgi:hypothetical protein
MNFSGVSPRVYTLGRLLIKEFKAIRPRDADFWGTPREAGANRSVKPV